MELSPDSSPLVTRLTNFPSCVDWVNNDDAVVRDNSVDGGDGSVTAVDEMSAAAVSDDEDNEEGDDDDDDDETEDNEEAVVEATASSVEVRRVESLETRVTARSVASSITKVIEN
jgi:Ran GTPase-activating protein (RanGAP) involved in mRNA processing and transport